jgi:hypothetical protein
MIITIAIISGSAIFIVLGSIHMLYTFRGNKFLARNSAVTEGMKQTQPVLTKETTMWKAWIGFNGSHSLGAIFFGVINIILSIEHPTVLSYSISIPIVNVLVCIVYLMLAKKYWFRIPLTGIAISTVLFMLALILNVIGN